MLGLAVALVLADSSVVTLALPDILARFDVGITEVAWVLISYNLILAGAAVPAAHLARRRPRVFGLVGLVVFAISSLACGLAGDFGILIAARCVQALGGAFVVPPRSSFSSGSKGRSSARHMCGRGPVCSGRRSALRSAAS